VSEQEHVTLGDFVLVLVFGVVVGGFVGWLTGVGLGIYGEETGQQIWIDWSSRTASIGAALGVAWAIWKTATTEARLVKAERERVEQAEREHAEAEEQRRANLAQSLVSQAEHAVNLFAWLPGYLDGAQGWTQQAVAAYRDGAFSPFWSAMENAYGQIALYRQTVDQIEQASREHARLLSVLAEHGWDITEVAEFPVQLDVARVQQTVDTATQSLNNMAYQAQREPTFALIWEQRRTTAAVIAGFANLETAVHGMRASVAVSLQSLENTLRTGNTQSQRLLSGLSRASDSLTTAFRTEAKTLRHLAQRSDQIRGELYRQNWGHYPLFS
jgi:hypothetical protein